MKCFFINQDAAVERRASVEADFAAKAPANWTLIRVPAVEIVADGYLRPAERACRESHVEALGQIQTEAGPCLVIEDDTRFSAKVFELAPRLMTAASDADLILLEGLPTNLAVLAQLARDFGRLQRAGEFRLENAGSSPVIGSSAYLVRPSSAPKLIAALGSPGARDKPYDMALSWLAANGGIRARLCFPYLTAPSKHADRSTIQGPEADLRAAAVHAFRRLMVIDRDLEACAGEVARISSAHSDESAKLAGAIFGALMSESFPAEY